MDYELLFYICGGVLVVSALLLTFVGLKRDNFPGRALPAIVLWFVIFVVAGGTFAVLFAGEEQEHRQHELEQAAEKVEEGSSGPFENEGGALGGEREELEEQAEKEAPGSTEEEPVGPTEDSQQGKADTGKSEKGGPEASATTLKLAANPTELLFDKEELSAKAGKVTIDFDNPSAIPHNVVIEKDGEELAGFEPITEGKETLSADLGPGSYTFICSVPGHAEAGMEGTLAVE
jgi:plastocyanin